MKALNVHKRKITSSKIQLSEMLSTLASKSDLIWPYESWPSMKLDKGLKPGSKGGHGIIGYSVTKYIAGKLIEFEFSKPAGFNGSHKLEIIELDANCCELKHTIEMETVGFGTLMWIFLVRPLHDALIKDAFDKVENRFSGNNKKSEWSLWVKMWRKLFKLIMRKKEPEILKKVRTDQ